jgi:hypothetical protein
VDESVLILKCLVESGTERFSGVRKGLFQITKLAFAIWECDWKAALTVRSWPVVVAEVTQSITKNANDRRFVFSLLGTNSFGWLCDEVRVTRSDDVNSQYDVRDSLFNPRYESSPPGTLFGVSVTRSKIMAALSTRPSYEKANDHSSRSNHASFLKWLCAIFQT